MDNLEKTGNTVEEAIASALLQLNTTRDMVNVEILEENAKGFLGIGKKLAKVRVTMLFDPIQTVRTFLKELTVAMNISAEIKIEEAGKRLHVDLSGQNMGVLIGKRGQTLDSIQHLTNLIVNKGTAPYVNVILDIENYRERRKKNLEILALNLGRRVKVTGRSVTLEPMSSSERRIIHFALEKERGIITKSMGSEPYRYVVIEPR